tara:strand:+ start:129 stop:773 length:645 start_codon:yes stop_codon:yes gene_type:complete
MVTLRELENYISSPAESVGTAAITYVVALKEILERGEQLTSKQEKAFMAIKSEKLTSDQRYEQWKDSFSTKMKEKTKIMANYYMEVLHTGKSLSPYERNNILPIAEIADQEPNYVPNQKHYEALCQGATAKKVLRQHYADPKFACGDLVVAREIGRKSHPLSCGDLSRGGYVIQTNAKPVSSTTKGSKWYSVLPIGNTKPCLIQERWLKKGKPY